MNRIQAIRKLEKLLEKLNNADEALSNKKFGSVARELDETRTMIAKLIEELED